ncbi:MAG: ornithine carbamoyltransferase [Spirochaetes bacterium]|nr:ornithine carbamoyltransferase [Spirochaetota bacterium]
MRHFISFLDFSTDELYSILDRADILFELWKENKISKRFKGKNIGLWFYDNGFRNRLAFEIGAKGMGAIVSYIPGEPGVYEPLEDMCRYLQNWYSLLVIRSNNHKDIIKLTENISIPVINARTDFNHPCEILGDLQYIKRVRKSLTDLNIVFIGEVTNICMSWFEATVKFPIKVTQIAPEGYLLDRKSLEKFNKQSKGKIILTSSMDMINEETDVLYTDCWPKSDDKNEKEKIKKLFLLYQVTENILSRLNDKAFFLPCPPVTRGEEVSENAMKSNLCKNYEAKKFLLHVQNAVMERILEINQEYL